MKQEIHDDQCINLRILIGQGHSHICAFHCKYLNEWHIWMFHEIPIDSYIHSYINLCSDEIVAPDIAYLLKGKSLPDPGMCYGHNWTMKAEDKTKIE